MRGPDAGPTARVAACLFVRNAENDIQEWIAYHSTLGIDTFFVYDNGSDDRTVAKARDLARRVHIHIIPWAHATGPRAQGDAYLDCLGRVRGELDWVLFIDSDEFLANPDREPVQALLTRHTDAAAIALNWACFGSNGHVSAPSGLTIESFTWRAADDFGPNAHTKMLVRVDRVVDYINPHFFTTAGEAVRADGGPVNWQRHGVTHTVDLASWRVNHYFVRSKAQWIRKILRGYRSSTVRHEREFVLYDRNELEDRTAALRAADVRQWLLDAVASGETADRVNGIPYARAS